MAYKRPLFSVIISCYNPGNYLDFLLNSLTRQGIKKSEMEIIISDDCSTKDYSNILKKYKRKLNIKKVKSLKNYGYPAHTRQQGVEAATGEWIIFSDQDDGFFDNALKKMKKYIKDNNCQNLIISGIYCGAGCTKEEDVFKRYPLSPLRNTNITHGIFINKDNTWDKFGLKYDYEIITLEEDTQIMTEMECLEMAGKITVDDMRPLPEDDIIYTYCWFQNSDSYSHNIQHNCSERSKFELTVHKYLKCRYYVFNKMLNKKEITEYYYCQKLIELLIYAYSSYSYYGYHNKINEMQPLAINDYWGARILRDVDSRMLYDDIILTIYSTDMEVKYTSNMFHYVFYAGKLRNTFPFPQMTIEEFLDRLKNLDFEELRKQFPEEEKI